MSVQFGVWNFDGKPVDKAYLEKVSQILAPYAPDGSGLHVRDNIALLYHAFHTTPESLYEKQPYILASGPVLTWDGRLDNREELIGLLSAVVTTESTDAEIVAAAFQHWGTDCFGKLLGDWALAVWDPHARALVLAKDFAGKRHLYYSIEKDQITWSTVLDPLVMFAKKQLELCEEYIAGWLAYFPAAHLSPYSSIQAVPPASFIAIQPEKQQITKYWDFDAGMRIRYSADGEYEEHFRQAFSQAVQRNLRSHATVGAHLSGGMDSTSIVCVADTLFAQGKASCPGLETISYFDDSEPNWDERPYFMLVEQKRGRMGCHIDVGAAEGFNFDRRTDQFPVSPACGSTVNTQFAAFLGSHGIRVILSGTGGDEATGGVPTPIPELEDLIARCQLRRLARQLKLWALNKRKPWFQLLFAALRNFLPLRIVGVPENRCPAYWLNGDFIRRNINALQGYNQRLKVFGPLPSFQENLTTLDTVCRQLAVSQMATHPAHETRYPYLDRRLLEFLYAIPREQILRPGQRRSLMRRALVGMLPDEILNRRRKASVSRKPALSLQLSCSQLCDPRRVLLSAAMKIIDPNKFLEVLRKAPNGLEVPLIKLMRTLCIELWLSRLQDQGLLSGNLGFGENLYQVVAGTPAQYVSAD